MIDVLSVSALPKLPLAGSGRGHHHSTGPRGGDLFEHLTLVHGYAVDPEPDGINRYDDARSLHRSFHRGRVT